MTWSVEFADEFEPEFMALHEEVQDTIMSMVHLLERSGPHLGRPHVDTLNGSRHANMKELRFRAVNGEWRLAFAFDPARQAIFLAAGAKSGHASRRFYRALIRKADERFDKHLEQLYTRGS